MRCRVAFVLLGMLVLGAGCARRAAPVDVRDYVRGLSFSSSYRELAGSYDSSVVPDLVEMLNSKTDEEYWVRIAGLLGVVGDERAVDALIAFIEKPVEPPILSIEHAAAYRSAFNGLGLLVNRIGSRRALSYLVDGLTPSVWNRRGVQGVARWQASREAYSLDLSKYALFGLAVSGDARAGKALRSLQTSPTSEQADFRNGLDDTLNQWLEVHQLVAERGVAGMYDYYKAKRQADPNAPRP